MTSISWFVAETVVLLMLAGPWVASGFGGRLRIEPLRSTWRGWPGR